MRRHDQSDHWEENFCHRKNKPKSNSFHRWNQWLKRRDRIEKLENAFGITVKCAGLALGIVAMLSIPGAKNTGNKQEVQPVEMGEKYISPTSEKVATILSVTNVVK